MILPINGQLINVGVEVVLVVCEVKLEKIDDVDEVVIVVVVDVIEVVSASDVMTFCSVVAVVVSSVLLK